LTSSLNIRKSAVVLFAVGLLLVGCRINTPDKGTDFLLQPGDLLFQDLDGSPLCDAIEKVTTGYHGADFTHVGIAAKDADGNFVVIEATQKGVVATRLKSFLDKSCDKSAKPKVAVGRLKPTYRHLIPSALKQAVALKGKPYDKLFVIGNDAWYCSELVYEIFLRANNNTPLFQLQPMTFIDPDTGKIFDVWKDYFAELAVPVPQGRPGINPGGISRSKVLTIVHTYSPTNGWKNQY
jgi:hypothetical protein